MRIAIISDIHANLPALEAVLADIERQRPDAIYCLGDLVCHNVWPNKVVERIRTERIPTIGSNYDVGIGSTSDDCDCAHRTDVERLLGKHSIAYTNATISNDNRAYLRGLPANVSIEYRLRSGGLYRVLLVHGAHAASTSTSSQIAATKASSVSSTQQAPTSSCAVTRTSRTIARSVRRTVRPVMSSTPNRSSTSTPQAA